MPLGSIVLSCLLIEAGGVGLPVTGGGEASAATPADRSAPSSTSELHPHHNHACDEVFDGHASGSLTKSTSAGPNGGAVLPGQLITVTLKWNPFEFGARNPSVSADCVMIGSHVSDSLSQVHLPGPSGGTDKFTYVVPSDGTNGQQICDRGVLLAEGDGNGDGSGGDGSGGDGSGGDGNGGSEQQHQAASNASGHDERLQREDDGHMEQSAVLCYTVQPAAVTPEAPMAVMFPVAALIVAGGSYLVYRRRRRVMPER